MPLALFTQGCLLTLGRTCRGAQALPLCTAGKSALYPSSSLTWLLWDPSCPGSSEQEAFHITEHPFRHHACWFVFLLWNNHRFRAGFKNKKKRTQTPFTQFLLNIEHNPSTTKKIRKLTAKQPQASCGFYQF